MLPSSVLILSHVLTTVPARDLEQYFVDHHIDRLFFIGHPLVYKADRPGSHYRFYRQGTLTAEKTYRPLRLPTIVQYMADIFLTWWWVITTGKRWNTVIALDNLNAFAAILLKNIGLVTHVIYYTIDFVPQRFPQRWLNNFYHGLDRWCVTHADQTWNVSPRISEGRHQLHHLPSAVQQKQHTVPIGIWLDRISQQRPRRRPHTLVYAGSLLPHQGIDQVLKALPAVIKKIPNVKFIVIGLGPEETALKNLVATLHLEKVVEFRGYLETHQEVETELLAAEIAMAMYSQEFDRWSHYADPSKIKTYLACGLPIITTDVTHIASQLTDRDCGIVLPADSTPQTLATTIITLMNHPRTIASMRQNALTFAKEFDWEHIFTQALSRKHT